MPKQQLALEKGGDKRLELSWGMGWRNFTIKLDGREEGKIDGGQKSLKEGQSFTLSDGSALFVQLKSGFPSGLRVLRNGKPVPGSSTDPRQRLTIATWPIIGLGILGTLSGILSLFAPVFQGLALGWNSIIFGIIVIGLGLWAKQGSALALWMVIILFLLDYLFAVYTSVSSDPSSVLGSDTFSFVCNGVFQILLFIWVYSGFGAIKELKAEQTAVTTFE